MVHLMFGGRGRSFFIIYGGFWWTDPFNMVLCGGSDSVNSDPVLISLSLVLAPTLRPPCYLLSMLVDLISAHWRWVLWFLQAIAIVLGFLVFVALIILLVFAVKTRSNIRRWGRDRILWEEVKVINDGLHNSVGEWVSVCVCMGECELHVCLMESKYTFIQQTKTKLSTSSSTNYEQ